ncbi:MAG: TetR/AcrR family transcriptional regulator [Pseudomonadota bacterium]
MPQPALTQAERTALSDTAMIDAAIDLIVNCGTEKTTLKALGETSGYSRGLVTYRFGSKSGLFKAVIKTVSERWLSAFERAVGSRRGIDALLRTARAYFRFVRRSPKDIRALQILSHQAVEPGCAHVDIVRKVFRAQRGQLAEWVQEGQAQGVINQRVDPDVFAASFCAFMSGMTWAWMLGTTDIDFVAAHAAFEQQIRLQLEPDAGPDKEKS